MANRGASTWCCCAWGASRSGTTRCVATLVAASPLLTVRAQTFTSKALGHASRLKLRHIVPLRRSSTYLSLYSPIDRIFALSYAAGDGDHKGKLHLRRNGTHVVLFDVSRAPHCRALV